MTLRRPPVFLSLEDHAALQQALALRPPFEDGRPLLWEEICRARLAPASRLPPDVVRLNSAVEFLDNLELEISAAQIVLPEEADGRSRISVTSPTGAALIGLRVGDTMRWLGPTGPRVVTITRAAAAAAEA